MHTDSYTTETHTYTHKHTRTHKHTQVHTHREVRINSFINWLALSASIYWVSLFVVQFADQLEPLILILSGDSGSACPACRVRSPSASEEIKQRIMAGPNPRDIRYYLPMLDSGLAVAPSKISCRRPLHAGRWKVTR